MPDWTDFAWQGRQVLITGGSGFLGGGIARRLLNAGAAVRVLQRSAVPELVTLGASVFRGPLTDGALLHRAAAGCDLVIHTAAKAGVWGSHADYHASNVIGTRKVLGACLGQGVPRLVYTSTPSVCYAGVDEVGIDESAPYGDHFLCHYAATKAQAEAEVLAADSERLRVTTLRPHLIWGPGDRHLVPRLVARAQAGKLKLVGSGGNRVDSTYIDNCVDAHLAAAVELFGTARCAGKPYFISNGEPLAIKELINGILAAKGAPLVERSVSPKVAYAAGAVLEVVYGMLGLQAEPLMTRFVAKQLSTEHFFDIGAAERDFDWRPLVPLVDGFTALRDR